MKPLNTEWICKCKEKGVVDWHLALCRIRSGWSLEDAISTPLRGRKKNDNFYKEHGVTKKEYCELHNIRHYQCFCIRMSKGMSVEEASKPPQYYLKGRKTKPIKHWVFYKNERMPLSKAFNILCEETNAFVVKKSSSVVKRAEVKNQTIQQAFIHYVRLYHKKYGRREL